MTEQSTQDESTIDSLADPTALRDRADVVYEEVTRDLEREKFEGLRERYDAIDGIAQVGVTTSDGRLLLQAWDGDSAWAPPGGDVEPGQDWVVAARRSIEHLIGVDVVIDDAELLEHLTFRLAGEAGTSFSSYGVSFSASLVDEESTFATDPTLSDDLDIPDDYDVALGWFDGVPEGVNENHVQDIEILLD